jgi:tRNA-specific 2-thiouridylase
MGIMGTDREGRIVVAMSGGVDSSVAAALLVQQGYEVVGITLKTHRYEDVGGKESGETSCCSLDGINDARAVASHLGFPHYVLDFSGRFEQEVIAPFVAEYLAGRTPNPCVLCNRTIKWEELLKKARALGAGKVATGHYARLCSDAGRYWIARGRDEGKDQSYALWGLTQDSLSRTVFPLAELTKPRVREIARDLGLASAGKGESYEICFIPDNDYGRFLKERLPGLAGSVDGGEMVRDGKVIGKHRGYPFYTIGQRRGLGLATGEPVYVTGIDRERNTVQVGSERALYHRGLFARDVNFMKYERLPDGFQADVRIRYKDGGGPGRVWMETGGRLRVEFAEPRRAPAPGQSVVLYEGDDLLGGGIIAEVTG